MESNRICLRGVNDLVLGAVLFLWICGCGLSTSVGPIASTGTFTRTLNASVDLKGEAIQQYGRVQWYPGADSHEDWVRLADAAVNGVVVLTDTRLLFLTWNGERYEKSREIAYVDATDVRRRAWTTTQRIVIETANGNIDSFSFFSNNGVGVSNPRVARALAFLRTKIRSTDAGVPGAFGSRSAARDSNELQ